MDKDKKAYYVVRGEEGYSEEYEVLRGPDGFECLVGEPEDRTFYRDLDGMVIELNRLQDQLKERREGLEWIPTGKPVAPPQIRISDALRAKAHSPTAKAVELCRCATVLMNKQCKLWEVLYNGMEQHTKDAVWESINLAHAHKAHTMKRAAPLRMVEIKQAIDSAEVK